MDKDELTCEYVNLYRKLVGSDEGLWYSQVTSMPEKRLKERIETVREKLKVMEECRK